MSDSTPKPESPPSSDPMWKRMATELRKEISNLKRDDQEDDFDDEANAIAVGVIVLGLLIGGFFLMRFLLKEPSIDPGYTQLEAIKRVEHLVLVRQHYETLIPVTDKRDEEKLKFLLKAPIEIDGYLDMSQVDFSLQSDSLVVVWMPPASIDTPYLDLQNTDIYAPGQSLLARLGEQARSEKVVYLEAYDQIRDAMAESRSHVRRRAVANGILSQTQMEGQRYLRNLINSLGYRVRFEAPLQLPPGISDSTRMEMLFQRMQSFERQLPSVDAPTRRSILGSIGRALR